jgi:hypothetical protein
VTAGVALLLVMMPVTPLKAERPSASAQSPPPRNVTYCGLAANPREFDKARIRLTAFVEFHFEHFVIADPACGPEKTDFSVWVTFGGNVASGAIYCCPGEGGSSPRNRPMPFPLVKDDTFRRFKSILDSEQDSMIRGTFVGTLFVKPESTSPADVMNGYGHFGCCSLFVIERVDQFDDHIREDLDYSFTLGTTEGRRCFSDREDSQYVQHSADLIRWQQEADAGRHPDAFDAPDRLALEAVRARYGPEVDVLVPVKVTPARRILEWRHGRSWTTVVMSRPSWLSYVSPSKTVAWTVTAIRTNRCAFEIDPTGDVKAQVIDAFRKAFGDPVVHPQLPANRLTTGRVAGGPGPGDATFFEVLQSHAVAVAFDDRGRLNWVDVRSKHRYNLPSQVLDLPEVLRHVPLYGQRFDELIVFIDALRPMGAAVGAVHQSGNVRTQHYEHATLTWEDGSRDKNGTPGSVRAFSVQWTTR